MIRSRNEELHTVSKYLPHSYALLIESHDINDSLTSYPTDVTLPKKDTELAGTPNRNIPCLTV